MLDASNPYIRMKGLIFGTTFVLKVKEENVYLILSSILLAQLLTGISVIVACRNTFCRDSGYIGIARILRGVAEKMGKFGSAATDKEIWAFYKNRRMRYGVTGGTELGEGMERLDILMDRQEVIRRKSMHAGGVYA